MIFFGGANETFGGAPAPPARYAHGPVQPSHMRTGCVVM